MPEPEHTVTATLAATVALAIITAAVIVEHLRLRRERRTLQRFAEALAAQHAARNGHGLEDWAWPTSPARAGDEQ